MRDVVICEPIRTAIGNYGGLLRDVPAAELAATVIRALVSRTGVPVEQVDDVLLGQCYPNGEAPAIGRVAALDAGLPVTAGGLQIDRRCGSGLQAVLYGVQQVAAGFSDLVLAGGAESMSQTEYYSLGTRWGTRGGDQVLHDRLARGRVTAGGANHAVPGGMIETAENLRREYSITREAQDELALQSHRRAVAAQESGIFAEEIVPVTVHGRRGDVVVDTDEGPRADTTAEILAGLRPIMIRADAGSTVTAGNASSQNDGASLCLITTRDRAEQLGIRAYARLVAAAVAGVPPATMGIGPVPAVTVALERAGLTLADLDLIELNEAFAAQVLACLRGLQLGRADQDRINVHGSGISLGHPVGATGGRILATMLRELQRRQGRYALETMCIGGGQGLAAIFERVT
ncbi:MAG TPA: acetyl-CoA C-acetyltransferase [Jatrophihabitantaceae bacterium]|jgi:acetyl-CoA acetyltransferase family protein|nr:acetyl-CoA C-acetyltransferase [Jatrophihabitantaceae bacterium]